MRNGKYTVGASDARGGKIFQTMITALLNQIHPIRRMDIVYKIFTAKLSGDKIGEPGSAMLTFENLKVGDKFISMPLPGDDSGHGGFKRGAYIFEKIKGRPSIFFRDEENDNAKRLMDGQVTTYLKKMHVIKVL